MSKCTGEMVGSPPHDEVKTPRQKAATFGWMVLPSCQGAQKPDKSILLLKSFIVLVAQGPFSSV